MTHFRDHARVLGKPGPWLATATALCAAVGCNDNGRLAVSGTVFHEGEPLSGVYVCFEGTSTQQSAGWGITNASGRFHAWGSGKAVGLLPGTYRVWIDIRSPEPDPIAAMRNQAPLKREWAKRYSREKSSLTVVIDQACDNLRITLD